MSPALASYLCPVVLLLPLFLATSARAQFTERTVETGLLWFQSSWGAAMADLDSDGDLDIYAGHHINVPILYWNDGAGNFSSATYPQPFSGPIDRHGVLLVSLDADDDPDMFIAHGGAGGGGTEANEFYRNDGGGAFVSLLGSANMSDPTGRTRCMSAADFNGDHRLDVFVGKAPDAGSPNRLYRNDLNFWFNDVAAAMGVDETDGTNGAIWGDVDNDGDPDLLVGGEEFPRPTRLFRNDGTTFTDNSSIFSPALPTLSGADWGDFDNDGDLDLAAADGQLGIFDAFQPANPVVYFFNTRYAENGVDGLTIVSVSDTATGEFSIRGFADTSIVFLGPNEVNPSQGIITLDDSYVGAPSFSPGVDRGTWIWRASPGGDWEIRCSTPQTNFDTFDGWLRQKSQSPMVTPRDLEDAGFTSGAPRVWRNDGGTFNEISAALGLPAHLINPRDISWVDFDNDGDLDLHVVDKGTSGVPNGPDKLYRNDGATFVDVTGAQKIAAGPNGMGDGGVWGDTDNDGDLDLYLLEGAGPAFYSAFGPTRHFVNDNGGTSIQITLEGRNSGPTAVGAKVTAVIGSLRVQRRVQANAWQGFQDPRRVHLGLNGAATADSLIIEWPFGTIEIYENLPAGIWTMQEGTVTPTDAPTLSEVATRGWGVATLRPQPARGPQTLQLTASRRVRLAVTVHDVSGRLIRRLLDADVAAGVTSVLWDGRDDRNRSVAAGVYFVRVSDGDAQITRRATRLR